MASVDADASPAPPEAIPLSQVEGELARRLREAHDDAGRPLHRAHMSNLIVVCRDEEQAAQAQAEIPGIVSIHPARVLLVVADDAPRPLTAGIDVRPIHGGPSLCTEQVTLRAGGHAASKLPYAVRGLLIGDLPTNLWWANPTPPPLAGNLLADLAEHAQQVVYDSLGWRDPHRGVSMTHGWLLQVEHVATPRRWRVASDLNWRRLKLWRRLLGQALSPATAPGAAESISEVVVEHGPHAVTQAWLIVSWLAARLKWKLRHVRVQQGVEMAWQFQTPRGPLHLIIRRLPDGPSELRRLRLSCEQCAQPIALDITAGENRLTVTPEGVEAAGRSVALGEQSIAELVGRQLSDREHDPVFREAMVVAHVLAQEVRV